MLPSCSIEQVIELKFPILSIEEARRQLKPLLHLCQRFYGRNWRNRYQASHAIPSMLFLERDRLIAQLRSWSSRFEVYLLSKHRHDTKNTDAVSRAAQESVWLSLAISLRMQNNTWYISLCNILTPWECSYDAYFSNYHQIIFDACAILTLNASAFRDNLKQFRVTGIIEPLYRTALHCRHRVWRRQAIDMINQAGVEGPWNGKLTAAVARRFADLEEGFAENRIVLVQSTEGNDSRPEPVLTDSGLPYPFPEVPPESARLFFVVINVKPSESLDGRISGRRTLRVRFNKCSDMNSVVLEGGHWDNRTLWDNWSEDLEF